MNANIWSEKKHEKVGKQLKCCLFVSGSMSLMKKQQNTLDPYAYFE